jgi:hypothetical protein
MGRTCSTNGEKGSAYRILMGKSERNTPLGRPRRGEWTVFFPTRLCNISSVGMVLSLLHLFLPSDGI